MPNRPEPRRSSLSAQHPYAPVTVEAPAAVAEVAAPEDKSPAAPPASEKAPTATAKKTKRQAADSAPVKLSEKKPMSVRATLDDQARIRAAFLATNSAERHGSLSDFVTKAALEKVAELEARYNDGERWSPVDAGDVPTGRPLR